MRLEEKLLENRDYENSHNYPVGLLQVFEVEFLKLSSVPSSLCISLLFAIVAISINTLVCNGIKPGIYN